MFIQSIVDIISIVTIYSTTMYCIILYVFEYGFIVETIPIIIPATIITGISYMVNMINNIFFIFFIFVFITTLQIFSFYLINHLYYLL